MTIHVVEYTHADNNECLINIFPSCLIKMFERHQLDC